MGYGDWIFVGALLIVAILGAMFGFGKVFSLFVLNKLVRIIIAVFVCYTFGGMILSIPFVNQLLADIAVNWADINILTKIHFEIILYYIVLFTVTMIIIFILSRVIRSISESQFLPIKILNKACGAILLCALAFVLMLLVFHIISLIGGETAKSLLVSLQTDANAIVRPLYENNPMTQWIGTLA